MIVTLNDLQILVDEYMPGWQVESQHELRRIIVRHPKLPGILSFSLEWFLLRETSDIIKRFQDFKKENSFLFQAESLFLNSKFVAPITKENPNYPESSHPGDIIYDETEGELRIYDASNGWISLVESKSILMQSKVSNYLKKARKGLKPAILGQRKIKLPKNEI